MRKVAGRRKATASDRVRDPDPLGGRPRVDEIEIGHKTYVTAKGTSKWSFSLRIPLRKGIYAVVARGIDAVGNIERPVRGSRARARHNHNHYLFKVR